MSILFYYVQLQKYKKERVSTNKVEEETDEIKKIKKVRSMNITKKEILINCQMWD